jgi:hypothetical protein
MLVPKTISFVANASASQSAIESPRLGPYIPLKPFFSISAANEIVAFRRPGTAARLSAGILSMTYSLEFREPDVLSHLRE